MFAKMENSLSLRRFTENMDGDEDAETSDDQSPQQRQRYDDNASSNKHLFELKVSDDDNDDHHLGAHRADTPSRDVDLSLFDQQHSQDMFDETYEYLEEDREEVHQWESRRLNNASNDPTQPTFDAGFFNKMLTAKVVLEKLPDLVLKEKLTNYEAIVNNQEANVSNDKSNGFYYVVKLQEFSNEKDIKELVNRNCIKCKIISKINPEKTLPSQEKCHVCKAGILWQCHKCQKSYQLYHSVIQHLNSTCNTKTSYKCSNCDYLTIRQTHIKKHFQEFHSTKKQNYQCACRLKFSTNAALRKHIKVCRQEELECKYCIFRTKSRRGFNLHLRKTHDIHSNAERHIKILRVIKEEPKSDDELSIHEANNVPIEVDGTIKESRNYFDADKTKWDEFEQSHSNILVEGDDGGIKIEAVFSLRPKIEKSKLFYKHCIKCGKMCQTSKSYKKHVEDCRKFKCDNCRFITSKKGILKQHISECYPSIDPTINLIDDNTVVDNIIVNNTSKSRIVDDYSSAVKKSSCQIA